MLKEQTKLISQMHKLWDILLTAAAFMAAYFIKKYLLPEQFRGLLTGPNYYLVLLLIIIIWYVSFSLFGLYSLYKKETYIKIFWNLIKSISIAFMLMILFMYLLKIKDVSRIMIGVFFFLDIVLLALSKLSIYHILNRYWRRGIYFRNILIIGSRDKAKDVITAIESHEEAGYRVIGCLELRQEDIGNYVYKDIKVIGTLNDLKKILLENAIDEIVFVMPLIKIENPQLCMSIAEEIGIQTRIIPDWQIYKLRYKPEIATIQFEDFLGIMTMTFYTTPARHIDLLIKSLFDYAFSGIAIIILSPLFLAISIIITLSSKGPVFYKQKRSGVNGRIFIMYKFRTMTFDAEEKRQELDELNEADGPAFKIKQDPRIIPFVGTFLRNTGIDELPQLINVLKGEMSLVGPRPPIPEEVEKYETWQRRRLSMKPGMTCIWQISPDRNQIGFHDWMKMDLEYIDNWSLWLDFKILIKTHHAVFMGMGR